MMIPIGIATLYFVRNKKIRTKIFVIILVSCLSGVIIELLQFILPIPRGVEVADGVLNMLSVSIGALIGLVQLCILKALKIKSK